MFSDPKRKSPLGSSRSPRRRNVSQCFWIFRFFKRGRQFNFHREISRF